MDKRLPIVTIVVKNYNNSKYLVEGLQRMVDQDYPAKQIVLVDNHSSDDSWNTIKNFCGDGHKENVLDNGVPLIQTMLNGVPVFCLQALEFCPNSTLWNIGIKTLWERTHLYTFLDSKDLMEPHKISKSVAKILENPDVIGGVYSDYYTLDMANNVQKRHHLQSYTIEELQHKNIAGYSFMMSKIALNVSGLFNEALQTAEDHELLVRATKSCLLVHIPEPLYTIRIKPKGKFAWQDLQQ